MGFSAGNFSASTPWLVIIMLDLDFFGWMYFGFLLLPNCLERVKISKTAIENLVYGWPLTLWCLIITVRLQSGTKEYSILSIFSAIVSREIGDDMFHSSCTSQSVCTFCVKCQDPFLPILIVYMENDPKFTARERGFELKFVSKMRNQILYDIKQNIQVKSERIP